MTVSLVANSSSTNSFASEVYVPPDSLMAGPEVFFEDVDFGEGPRSHPALSDVASFHRNDTVVDPNGSVITPHGKTVIVGETFGGQCQAFDT